jgi:limonene 1,2-monooxygenase
VIGTPDDLVASIRHLQEITGGFGTALGFIHDWANPANTAKSWDMVARYVIPEVNGMLDAYRESQQHVINNRDSFERAGEAVMQKIMQNERAAAALAEPQGKAAMSSHNAPDLSKYQNKSAG